MNVPTTPSREDGTAGEAMHRLMSDLYPICRSITGDGLRRSLRMLQEHVPLQLHEVPTGTSVLDWTVPKEWNVRDAYVRGPSGEKVIDFQQCNLHLLNYSVPVHERMSLEALKPHLHSLPEHPDWIPYRTSYYQENWGFCLPHRDLLALEEGTYEVRIDTTLAPGHLTYGELFLPGELEEEVLLSCHCCHPSLCNDNLSGMALTTFLARELADREDRRYSYRFLFIPGTIGSITWLSRNEPVVGRIRHGLVVACVGDGGIFHYKKSRHGDAEIDRAALHVLQQAGQDYRVLDFTPYGYDERQYSSPGYNLPVGSLSRTPHSSYPEYHTSADNLDLVQPAYLAESLTRYRQIIDVLERNRRYRNTNPKGEPQLGRRGLYGAFGGRKDARAYEMAMLWVLNFSDGAHSLLDIADRAGLAFDAVHVAAQALLDKGLLEEVTGGGRDRPKSKEPESME